MPWRAAYRSLGLLGGEKQFVLGASGHIAGVINPPAGRQAQLLGFRQSSGQADDWLAQAQEERGSWWPRLVAVAGPVQGRQRR